MTSTKLRRWKPGTNRSRTSAFSLPNVVSGLGAMPSVNVWRMRRLNSGRGCSAVTAPVGVADVVVPDAEHVVFHPGGDQGDLGFHELRDAGCGVQGDGRPHPADAVLGHALALQEAAGADAIRVRGRGYLGGTDACDPAVSPVYASLAGLPPLLIQAGSHEILLDDAIRLAARAACDEVAVTLDVVPGVPHVFQAYAALLDEGEAR